MMMVKYRHEMNNSGYLKICLDKKVYINELMIYEEIG